jgi:hypothetical protein
VVFSAVLHAIMLTAKTAIKIGLIKRYFKGEETRTARLKGSF